MVWLLPLTLLISLAAQAGPCPAEVPAQWTARYRDGCQEFTPNQPIRYAGRGIESKNGKYDLAVVCVGAVQNGAAGCHELAFGLGIRETRKAYLLPVRYGMPQLKDAANENQMIEARILASLTYLTRNQWNRSFRTMWFGKQGKPKGSYFLAAPFTSQTGWDWADQPSRVSDEAFSDLVESLFVPVGMDAAAFCAQVEKMSALADLAQSQSLMLSWKSTCAQVSAKKRYYLF